MASVIRTGHLLFHVFWDLHGFAFTGYDNRIWWSAAMCSLCYHIMVELWAHCCSIWASAYFDGIGQDAQWKANVLFPYPCRDSLRGSAQMFWHSHIKYLKVFLTVSVSLWSLGGKTSVFKSKGWALYVLLWDRPNSWTMKLSLMY